MSKKIKPFSFTHEQNYYAGNVELINSTTTGATPEWRVHLEAKKTSVKRKAMIFLKTQQKNKFFGETVCTSLCESNIMKLSIESNIKEEILKTLKLQGVDMNEFFVETEILPLVEEVVGLYVLK